jgi:hypothetical protein
MKTHRDAIAAIAGLVFGVAAMAGTVLSDEYAHAAGAEARGYDALFHVVAMNDGCGACDDAAASAPHAAARPMPVPLAPAILMAANEVRR